MPRAKNKGASTRIRDNMVADFWTTLINRALDAKKNYVSTAKQVERYLGPDHSELFETIAPFVDLKGASSVTVPKIAQMRNTLGPRLYQTRPVRTVTPTTDDGVMLALAKVLSEYLNYTVRETNFKRQLRKAIDDSMIRGRGVLAQEIDPVRGVVTSRYVSSMDFVFDPDFDDVEDAKWVAFRVTEPLWETKRRVTEKWRLKGLGRDVDAGTHKQVEDKRQPKPSVSAEQLAYWVVLSKMGAGFRGMDKTTRNDDSKDFVRLEIVLDHAVPLAEGRWDVPFYLDKGWPVSTLDLIDPIDCGWPDSIGGQVLGSQEAIDILSSLRLSSCKNRDRVVVFGDRQVLNKASVNQFRHGTPADFIELDLPQGKGLNDAIMVADFGQGSQETLLEREYHTQQMEVTTGVTDVLHGGQEPDAKERSATASQLRSDAANARVSDLRDRVESFHADAGRKEAVITRLLLDADEVAPIVRASKIGMFYVRVQVPGGAPVPVRDTRPEEERKAQPLPDVLTLEQISPQASNFFEDPMEATMAAQALFQDLLVSEEPRVMELGAAISPNDVDPMTGLPSAISVDVVTVETVWEATAGVTAEELMREFSYELATGSGHQLNREAMQANADYLVQTVMPAAMSVFQTTGDPSSLNKILAIRDEAFEVPQHQRIQFEPLMMPEPQGEGSEESKDAA